VLAHFETIRDCFTDELARRRGIWETWYSPVGFFEALAQDLRRRLNATVNAR
jgi:hypothetical protein